MEYILTNQVIAPVVHHKPKTVYAVILSFIFPGAGHLYTGQIRRAITMQIIRFFPLMLIPAAAVPENGFNTLIVSSACLALSSLSGPLSAAIIYFEMKRQNAINFPVRKPAVAVLAFCLISILINSISAAAAFTTVTPIKLSGETLTPHLKSGDVILLNRYPKLKLKRGDLVLTGESGSQTIKRVIASGGDIISISSDAIIVNGQPLERTTLPQHIKDSLNPGNTETILIESGFGISYAVTLPPPDSDEFSGEVPEETYFILPDNRSSGYNFSTVRRQNIQGRVEGVFLTTDIGRILSSPGYIDNINHKK